MNMFEIFRRGASVLANASLSYGDLHKMYGIAIEDWKLLTTDKLWTLSERQKIRSILIEMINISLTIAGIPPQSLPVQYVAALISSLVAPCNRLVACSCSPETYDAVAASGLEGPVQFVNTDRQTLTSLVLAYSSHVYIEPSEVVDPYIQAKVTESLATDKAHRNV